MVTCFIVQNIYQYIFLLCWAWEGPGNLPNTDCKSQWVIHHLLLQEGGPLPGPETELLSNTQKWIVRGDTRADKAGGFIGKERPGGEQEGTQENCSATVAGSLGVYGDGISVRVVFSHSFWLRVLPGNARLVHPRWMPVRRILEGGRTCGVSFWPLLNSPSWWWLINSMVLTRTSCHKTHSNGYYDAWPGWAVSVRVLPLTLSPQRPAVLK